MDTINFETYARIIAHLACRRGARLEEILAEMGVDADELRLAEPTLRKELSSAWPNRKGIAAMKFATALGTELERLGALGSDNLPPNPLAGEPPLPQLPTDARPREPELPSFLQAAPARVPIEPVAPFAPVPAPAPVAIAPPPIVPAHVDVEPASSNPLAGTANMDLSAIVAAVRRGSLPFNPSHESSPSSSATPPRETDTKARVEATQTGTGTVAVGTPVAAPPLPEGVVELTVQQYASLRVELQTNPGNAASIASRYRVPEEGLEALDAYWRARFEADPLLRMEFARAYAAYLAWLRNSAGG